MRLLAKILFAILFLTATAFAGDVTKAPTLMPNFPMLAGDNVMVMWVPVPGAVKYRIYQNVELVGEVEAPPFTHPAPTEPGEYRYMITGVDAVGVEGPKSPEEVLSIVKLTPPKNLQARYLGEILNIRWDAVLNAVIYDIYRAESREGPYKLIASVTETRCVDAEIKNTDEKLYGKKFYYKIVAKDKFNKESPESEIYELAVPLPPPPPRPDKITLKIRRSKEVAFVQPPGIQSCFDAQFLSDAESLVYVDTFAKKVAVIDITGKELRAIGSAGIRPDQYIEPIRLAIDGEDDIYILDNKKPKIFVYSSGGEFKTAYDLRKVNGKKIIVEYYGEDVISTVVPPDEVTPKPNAILINGGKILVADKITGAVQIYSKTDGRFIGYLNNKEIGKVQLFTAISKMLIGDNEKLYLAESAVRLISVFSLDAGKEYYKIGISKTFAGSFMSINGIAFDNNGDLVISDGVMHSVQVFNKNDGAYMYHIGGEKAAPEERAKDQRPKVNFDFVGPVNVDKNGRVWVYLGRDKGFSIREYTGDKLWDAYNDKPEL